MALYPLGITSSRFFPKFHFFQAPPLKSPGIFHPRVDNSNSVRVSRRKRHSVPDQTDHSAQSMGSFRPLAMSPCKRLTKSPRPGGIAESLILKKYFPLRGIFLDTHTQIAPLARQLGEAIQVHSLDRVIGSRVSGRSRSFYPGTPWEGSPQGWSFLTCLITVSETQNAAATFLEVALYILPFNRS